MAKLLTKQELTEHLRNFRSILANFDYSPIKNIRFFNLDSLYDYMEHVEHNPFQEQYQALQDELDYLQPYLPFVSSERAASFLTAMSHAKNDDEIVDIKKDFTKKLRQDFINLTRTTTTDMQWDSILSTCEEIRSHKEEMTLATY